MEEHGNDMQGYDSGTAHLGQVTQVQQEVSCSILINSFRFSDDIHVITPAQFALQAHDHDRDGSRALGDINFRFSSLGEVITQ